MNLDELKSTWNNDNNGNVSVPQNIQQLKKAQHPLDKLKDNMKKEWYLQLGAIVFLGFVPQLQDFHPSVYKYYYGAYVFMVIVSVYYLNSFKNFYTNIVHYSSDTKESLTIVYNEFTANIRRYHIFGFVLIPFCVVWIGLFIYSMLLEKGRTLDSLSEQTIVYIAIAAVSTIVLFIAALFGWTKHYYGKYLTQISSVLDELKD